MEQSYANWQWVTGYNNLTFDAESSTCVTEYLMTDLMNKGCIEPTIGQAFLEAGGLFDFHWEMTWHATTELSDADLLKHMEHTHGFVIWVHGWTGNLHIWEESPTIVVQENHNLISIAVDHNGFGLSRFIDENPAPDKSDPSSTMDTLKNFIDLMHIHDLASEHQPRVLNFVGHSMGGAALFFLDPDEWLEGEVTRMAVAPALLPDDAPRQIAYRSLGVGIGLLQRVYKLPVFNWIEKGFRNLGIHLLVKDASEHVVELHKKQYDATSRGTTGATFRGIGLERYTFHDAREAYWHRLPEHNKVALKEKSSKKFDLMHVMLGNRDIAIGAIPMIDFLGDIDFPFTHIHVVPGTHYMFSINKRLDKESSETMRSHYQHRKIRDMLITQVLDLHKQAMYRQMQRINRVFETSTFVATHSPEEIKQVTTIKIPQ